MDNVQLCPHGLPMFKNIPAGNELGCAEPLKCFERLNMRIAVVRERLSWIIGYSQSTKQMELTAVAQAALESLKGVQLG